MSLLAELMKKTMKMAKERYVCKYVMEKLPRDGGRKGQPHPPPVEIKYYSDFKKGFIQLETSTQNRE